MNPQVDAWGGTFGRVYSDRNFFTLDELDAVYRRAYGITCTELQRKFLSDLDRDTRILDVGQNSGNQLVALRAAGFRRLFGVDISEYALRLSSERHGLTGGVRGSAFGVPFADRAFDLVLTSGLLIHIAPQHLGRVLDEVHRCTRTWILGFESHADRWTEVPYRGERELYWKADYAREYMERFDDLELVRQEAVPLLGTSNVDRMFLLRRTPR